VAERVERRGRHRLEPRILLDLHLPDGDGLELLDRLPRSGGRPGVPVVMLTGQGNEAVAVAAMKAGAKDYLPKDVLTPDALRRAAAMSPPAAPWSLLWFGGLVNLQNGRFDEAISSFEQIVEGGFQEAVGRGFDFSKDYRVLDQLGQAIFERAKQERGSERDECPAQLREHGLVQGHRRYP